MDSIEYFATNALISELQSRFEDCVIIAASRRTDKEDDMVACLSGSYHGILGLIAVARMAAEQGDTHGTDSTD